jgi:twitching motility protein PilT
LKRSTLLRVIDNGAQEGVKSIFFFAGFPPMGNIRQIVNLNEEILEERDVVDILQMTASHQQCMTFMKEKELDYGYEVLGAGRFRVNAFLQRGSYGIVMRPIPEHVPSFDSLHLPPVLKDFTELRDGLVLVTGPTGSGKSTTLASLIDIINRKRSCHILTIEDPVEFVHRPIKSIISQREVGKDTKSFVDALKRLTREDPDVVLIGEIRDKGSMTAAIEIASIGHLVFATLHTNNVYQSINRIMDFFSDDERNQARNHISAALKGIVCQRLLQRSGGNGFVVACEIMKTNQAVKNLIREGKGHQIYSVMDSSRKDGMVLMDDALFDLHEKGLVEMEEALLYASNADSFRKRAGIERWETSGRADRPLSNQTNGDTTVYEANLSPDSVGHLETSGLLTGGPQGLLFRDTGMESGDFHFVADYSILHGRTSHFPLGPSFRLSYKIIDSAFEGKSYNLKLSIMAEQKETIEILVQGSLLADGEWHEIDLPIPGNHSGKQVRYYMIIFDRAIREILFDSIRFQ